MCDFFSFNSDGNGTFFYFTPKEIKKVEQTGNPKKLNFNSHASIAEHFKLKEDKCNKYEYNPFSKEFEIDQTNSKDDKEKAEKWVRAFFEAKNGKELIKFHKAFLPKLDYKALEKQFEGIPTENKKAAIKTIKRIEDIEWFKPQRQPSITMLQSKVNLALKAFHYDVKAKVELKVLKTSEDWAAAKDAAWAAAWDAAWAAAKDAAKDAAWVAAGAAAWDAAGAAAWAAAKDAAWAAAWDIIKDLMPKKGYKTNPFKLLMDLWAKGFYVCGVNEEKKFVIYYVPLKEAKRK